MVIAKDQLEDPRSINPSPTSVVDSAPIMSFDRSKAYEQRGHQEHDYSDEEEDGSNNNNNTSTLTNGAKTKPSQFTHRSTQQIMKNQSSSSSLHQQHADGSSVSSHNSNSVISGSSREPQKRRSQSRNRYGRAPSARSVQEEQPHPAQQPRLTRAHTTQPAVTAPNRIARPTRPGLETNGGEQRLSSRWLSDSSQSFKKNLPGRASSARAPTMPGRGRCLDSDDESEAEEQPNQHRNNNRNRSKSNVDVGRLHGFSAAGRRDTGRNRNNDSSNNGNNNNNHQQKSEALRVPHRRHNRPAEEEPTVSRPAAAPVVAPRSPKRFQQATRRNFERSRTFDSSNPSPVFASEKLVDDDEEKPVIRKPFRITKRTTSAPNPAFENNDEEAPVTRTPFQPQGRNFDRQVEPEESAKGEQSRGTSNQSEESPPATASAPAPAPRVSCRWGSSSRRPVRAVSPEIPPEPTSVESESSSSPTSIPKAENEVTTMDVEGQDTTDNKPPYASPISPSIPRDGTTAVLPSSTESTKDASYDDDVSDGEAAKLLASTPKPFVPSEGNVGRQQDELESSACEPDVTDTNDNDEGRQPLAPRTTDFGRVGAEPESKPDPELGQHHSDNHGGSVDRGETSDAEESRSSTHEHSNPCQTDFECDDEETVSAANPKFTEPATAAHRTTMDNQDVDEDVPEPRSSSRKSFVPKKRDFGRGDVELAADSTPPLPATPDNNEEDEGVAVAVAVPKPNSLKLEEEPESESVCRSSGIRSPSLSPEKTDESTAEPGQPQRTAESLEKSDGVQDGSGKVQETPGATKQKPNHDAADEYDPVRRKPFNAHPRKFGRRWEAEDDVTPDERGGASAVAKEKDFVSATEDSGGQTGDSVVNTADAAAVNPSDKGANPTMSTPRRMRSVSDISDDDEDTVSSDAEINETSDDDIEALSRTNESATNSRESDEISREGRIKQARTPKTKDDSHANVANPDSKKPEQAASSEDWRKEVSGDQFASNTVNENGEKTKRDSSFMMKAPLRRRSSSLSDSDEDSSSDNKLYAQPSSSSTMNGPSNSSVPVQRIIEEQFTSKLDDEPNVTQQKYSVLKAPPRRASSPESTEIQEQQKTSAPGPVADAAAQNDARREMKAPPRRRSSSSSSEASGSQTKNRDPVQIRSGKVAGSKVSVPRRTGSVSDAGSSEEESPQRKKYNPRKFGSLRDLGTNEMDSSSKQSDKAPVPMRQPRRRVSYSDDDSDDPGDVQTRQSASTTKKNGAQQKGSDEEEGDGDGKPFGQKAVDSGDAPRITGGGLRAPRRACDDSDSDEEDSERKPRVPSRQQSPKESDSEPATAKRGFGVDAAPRNSRGFGADPAPRSSRFGADPASQSTGRAAPQRTSSKILRVTPERATSFSRQAPGRAAVAAEDPNSVTVLHRDPNIRGIPGRAVSMNAAGLSSMRVQRMASNTGLRQMASAIKPAEPGGLGLQPPSEGPQRAVPARAISAKALRVTPERTTSLRRQAPGRTAEVAGEQGEVTVLERTGPERSAPLRAASMNLSAVRRTPERSTSGLNRQFGGQTNDAANDGAVSSLGGRATPLRAASMGMPQQRQAPLRTASSLRRQVLAGKSVPAISEEGGEDCELPSGRPGLSSLLSTTGMGLNQQSRQAPQRTHSSLRRQQLAEQSGLAPMSEDEESVERLAPPMRMAPPRTASALRRVQLAERSGLSSMSEDSESVDAPLSQPTRKAPQRTPSAMRRQRLAEQIGLAPMNEEEEEEGAQETTPAPSTRMVPQRTTSAMRRQRLAEQSGLAPMKEEAEPKDSPPSPPTRRPPPRTMSAMRRQRLAEQSGLAPMNEEGESVDAPPAPPTRRAPARTPSAMKRQRLAEQSGLAPMHEEAESVDAPLAPPTRVTPSRSSSAMRRVQLAERSGLATMSEDSESVDGHLSQPTRKAPQRTHSAMRRQRLVEQSGLAPMQEEDEEGAQDTAPAPPTRRAPQRTPSAMRRQRLAEQSGLFPMNEEEEGAQDTPPAPPARRAPQRTPSGMRRQRLAEQSGLAPMNEEAEQQDSPPSPPTRRAPPRTISAMRRQRLAEQSGLAPTSEEEVSVDAPLPPPTRRAPERTISAMRRQQLAEQSGLTPMSEEAEPDAPPSPPTRRAPPRTISAMRRQRLAEQSGLAPMHEKPAAANASSALVANMTMTLQLPDQSGLMPMGEENVDNSLPRAPMRSAPVRASMGFAPQRKAPLRTVSTLRREQLAAHSVAPIGEDEEENDFPTSNARSAPLRAASMSVAFGGSRTISSALSGGQEPRRAVPARTISSKVVRVTPERTTSLRSQAPGGNSEDPNKTEEARQQGEITVLERAGPDRSAPLRAASMNLAAMGRRPPARTVSGMRRQVQSGGGGDTSLNAMDSGTFGVGGDSRATPLRAASMNLAAMGRRAPPARTVSGMRRQLPGSEPPSGGRSVPARTISSKVLRVTPEQTVSGLRRQAPGRPTAQPEWEDSGTSAVLESSDRTNRLAPMRAASMNLSQMRRIASSVGRSDEGGSAMPLRGEPQRGAPDRTISSKALRVTPERSVSLRRQAPGRNFPAQPDEPGSVTVMQRSLPGHQDEGLHQGTAGRSIPLRARSMNVTALRVQRQESMSGLRQMAAMASSRQGPLEGDTTAQGSGDKDADNQRRLPQRTLSSKALRVTPERTASLRQQAPGRSSDADEASGEVTLLQRTNPEPPEQDMVDSSVRSNTSMPCRTGSVTLKNFRRRRSSLETTSPVQLSTGATEQMEPQHSAGAPEPMETDESPQQPLSLSGRRLPGRTASGMVSRGEGMQRQTPSRAQSVSAPRRQLPQRTSSSRLRMAPVRSASGMGARQLSQLTGSSQENVEPVSNPINDGLSPSPQLSEGAGTSLQRVGPVRLQATSENGSLFTTLETASPRAIQRPVVDEPRRPFSSSNMRLTAPRRRGSSASESSDVDQEGGSQRAFDQGASQSEMPGNVLDEVDSSSQQTLPSLQMSSLGKGEAPGHVMEDSGESTKTITAVSQSILRADGADSDHNEVSSSKSDEEACSDVDSEEGAERSDRSEEDLPSLVDSDSNDGPVEESESVKLDVRRTTKQVEMAGEIANNEVVASDQIMAMEMDQGNGIVANDTADNAETGPTPTAGSGASLTSIPDRDLKASMRSDDEEQQNVLPTDRPNSGSRERPIVILGPPSCHISDSSTGKDAERQSSERSNAHPHSNHPTGEFGPPKRKSSDSSRESEEEQGVGRETSKFPEFSKHPTRNFGPSKERNSGMIRESEEDEDCEPQTSTLAVSAAHGVPEHPKRNFGPPKRRISNSSTESEEECLAPEAGILLVPTERPTRYFGPPIRQSSDSISEGGRDEEWKRESPVLSGLTTDDLELPKWQRGDFSRQKEEEKDILPEQPTLVASHLVVPERPTRDFEPPQQHKSHSSWQKEEEKDVAQEQSMLVAFRVPTPIGPIRDFRLPKRQSSNSSREDEETDVAPVQRTQVSSALEVPEQPPRIFGPTKGQLSNSTGEEKVDLQPQTSNKSPMLSELPSRKFGPPKQQIGDSSSKTEGEEEVAAVQNVNVGSPVLAPERTTRNLGPPKRQSSRTSIEAEKKGAMTSEQNTLAASPVPALGHPTQNCEPPKRQSSDSSSKAEGVEDSAEQSLLEASPVSSPEHPTRTFGSPKRQSSATSTESEREDDLRSKRIGPAAFPATAPEHLTLIFGPPNRQISDSSSKAEGGEYAAREQSVVVLSPVSTPEGATRNVGSPKWQSSATSSEAETKEDLTSELSVLSESPAPVRNFGSPKRHISDSSNEVEERVARKTDSSAKSPESNERSRLYESRSLDHGGPACGGQPSTQGDDSGTSKYLSEASKSSDEENPDSIGEERGQATGDEHQKMHLSSRKTETFDAEVKQFQVDEKTNNEGDGSHSPEEADVSKTTSYHRPSTTGSPAIAQSSAPDVTKSTKSETGSPVISTLKLEPSSPDVLQRDSTGNAAPPRRRVSCVALNEEQDEAGEDVSKQDSNKITFAAPVQKKSAAFTDIDNGDTTTVEATQRQAETPQQSPDLVLRLPSRRDSVETIGSVTHSGAAREESVGSMAQPTAGVEEVQDIFSPGVVGINARPPARREGERADEAGEIPSDSESDEDAATAADNDDESEMPPLDDLASIRDDESIPPLDDLVSLRDDESMPALDDLVSVKDDESMPPLDDLASVRDDESMPPLDDALSIRDDESMPALDDATSVRDDESYFTRDDGLSVKDDDSLFPPYDAMSMKDDESIVNDDATSGKDDDSVPPFSDVASASVRDDESMPAFDDETTVKDDDRSKSVSAHDDQITNTKKKKGANNSRGIPPIINTGISKTKRLGVSFESDTTLSAVPPVIDTSVSFDRVFKPNIVVVDTSGESQKASRGAKNTAYTDITVFNPYMATRVSQHQEDAATVLSPDEAVGPNNASVQPPMEETKASDNEAPGDDSMTGDQNDLQTGLLSNESRAVAMFNRWS